MARIVVLENVFGSVPGALLDERLEVDDLRDERRTRAVVERMVSAVMEAGTRDRPLAEPGVARAAESYMEVARA